MTKTVTAPAKGKSGPKVGEKKSATKVGEQTKTQTRKLNLPTPAQIKSMGDGLEFPIGCELVVAWDGVPKSVAEEMQRRAKDQHLACAVNRAGVGTNLYTVNVWSVQ